MNATDLMWTEPLVIYIVGVLAVVMAGTACATWLWAYPLGLRRGELRGRNAGYAAGLAVGRAEPRPAARAEFWAPSDQVIRTPPPAALFTPQIEQATTPVVKRSHAELTRTRVSTTVGKRWRGDVEHTTALPAVAPEEVQ